MSDTAPQSRLTSTVVSVLFYHILEGHPVDKERAVCPSLTADASNVEKVEREGRGEEKMGASGLRAVVVGDLCAVFERKTNRFIIPLPQVQILPSVVSVCLSVCL